MYRSSTLTPVVTKTNPGLVQRYDGGPPWTVVQIVLGSFVRDSPDFRSYMFGPNTVSWEEWPSVSIIFDQQWRVVSFPDTYLTLVKEGRIVCKNRDCHCPEFHVWESSTSDLLGVFILLFTFVSVKKGDFLWWNLSWNVRIKWKSMLQPFLFVMENLKKLRLKYSTISFVFF